MNPWQPYPFPHAVLHDLFRRELLERVAAEFPDPDTSGWQRFGNAEELKLARRVVSGAAVEYFDELRDHTEWLEWLTGIPNLSMEMIGGGYHLIPPGGFLKVHTDFNRSPQTGLYRRLNVLTYLNEEDPGGHLELWDDHGVMVDVAPMMGTTVVFETSDHSWHGHPTPTTGWRKSVAAYFFSPDPPPGYAGDHSTVWHAR